jgi:hypothetical protein
VGTLNPFGEAVSDEVVADWLNQFEPEERDVAEQLLVHFRFYGFAQISAALRELHAKILAATRDLASSTWYVPVGYVAKSGSLIAYFYKIQNEVTQESFILISDLKNISSDRASTIVFLDDYIGTGHQAAQVWNAFRSLNPRLAEEATVIFAAIVAMRRGVEYLSQMTGFRVIVVDVIEESDLPLAAQSSIFPADGDRARARTILEKYGARLRPKGPLGYGNSQGLLGFIYSTPNNTLPIFWSTESGWKPLLPHKESYRDPSSLFGPPAGLPKEAAMESPDKPLAESAALSGYEIAPEIASKIFTEFRRTDIFLVLAPVVRSLDIPEGAFSQLLRLIGELKHLVHEKEGVSSALLVVPQAALEELPKLAVSAASGITLASLDEVLAIIQLVKAADGALVIRPDGTVLGTTLFPPAADDALSFLPLRYQKAANASLKTGGLLFFFTGEGRASVFHSGQRLLAYRGASWHLQPSDMKGGVRTLAKRYHVDEPALLRVFQLCFRLSDEGHGALLVVGDHQRVLGLAEPPKTAYMRWPQMNVGLTEPEAILGLMRQDGATIIGADGTVLQGMTPLRPPVDAPGAVEVGRGTKHATAAKISGATGSLTIAVSVDGRITVYGGGEILLKIMG